MSDKGTVCDDCGQEGKGLHTKICNSCSGITGVTIGANHPSKWIPKTPLKRGE